MANNRAKSLQEATFLLEKVLIKVEKDGPHIGGQWPRPKQAKLDEINNLMEEIKSIEEADKEAEELIKNANELFEDEFFLDGRKKERRKVLMQLNDYRRKGKTTVIRISGEARDKLCEIGEDVGLEKDREIVEYLIQQFKSTAKDAD